MIDSCGTVHSHVNVVELGELSVYLLNVFLWDVHVAHCEGYVMKYADCQGILARMNACVTIMALLNCILHRHIRLNHIAFAIGSLCAYVTSTLTQSNAINNNKNGLSPYNYNNYVIVL